MAKKNFENVIGKIIYGTLLFMPLVSILARTMYVVCNKNAYESYYGETINQKEAIHIDNITTFSGTMYFENTEYITYSNTNGQNIFNVSNFQSSLNIDNTQVNKILMYSAVYQTDYNMWVSLRDNNNTVIQNINLRNTLLQFTCNVEQYSKENNNVILGNFENCIYTYEYETYSYLDNVFEYSIYQVEQSQYYNWTTNTAIYTVIHNTTTTLQINNSFVDLLLTYWMLMSVIYVIYDIAIIMIQLAHKKVHEIIEK